MLSHDTGGMDDTAIVDAAIEDSHDDGQLQCEASGCGEYADVANITPRTITSHSCRPLRAIGCDPRRRVRWRLGRRWR